MTKHHAHYPRTGRAELLHQREQIDGIIRQVLEAMAGQGYVEASKFAVRLAMEEAISNAFRHGHRGLPQSAPVSVEWSVDADSLRIVVRDRGPGFDPGAVPDPTLEENLEMPSGRGLMLMRAYMSVIEFAKGGTEVIMEYRKPPKA